MREKDGIIMQIQEFGQTPKQLYNVPHPSRNSTSVGGGSVQVIDVVTKSSGSGVDKMVSPSSRRPASTSTTTPITSNTATTNNTTYTSTNTSTNITSTITKPSHTTNTDSILAQQQLEQLMISSEKLLQEKNSAGTYGTSGTGGVGKDGRLRSSSNTSHTSSASNHTNTITGKCVLDAFYCCILVLFCVYMTALYVNTCATGG